MASQSQQEVAKAAARGTLATLVLRLISFACTQWTFRVLDPATLGRASIQLELLLTTVLFISREGFRLALTKNISSESWNVAWLSVPLATVVSVLALGWHLWVTGSVVGDDDSNNIDYDYRWAGILYCIASCIEGWAEPAVLVTLRQMNIAVKASAEGLATVGKTVTIVIALRYLQNDWPVTAFGIAQMTYAIVYAIFLYSKTWSQLIGPKWNAFDRKTCYMTVVFTTQGFFKHLLTEGDRIVLTTLSGSYDQGVYAMGSAYGGMAARIILQPIEENARLLWSRLATQKIDATTKTTTATDPLEQSYTVLVKLVLYVGLVFSCIAVNYTSVLLNLLAGRKWGNNAEANAVLSAFCVYTAFLAWNGMTEAFLYGVASSGVDMGRLGAAHTAIGVLFACVAPLAVTKYGATGLVAANCVAMFLRAIYSVNYAAGFFASRQQKPFLSTLWRLLDQMFPRRQVILAFIGSYFATRASFNRLVDQADELQLEAGSLPWLRLSLQHVGVGIACAIGLASLAFPLEREFRRSARSTWHGKQD
jgi:oligosaccharide translocation protein RFT1